MHAPHIGEFVAGSAPHFTHVPVRFLSQYSSWHSTCMVGCSGPPVLPQYTHSLIVRHPDNRHTETAGCTRRTHGRYWGGRNCRMCASRSPHACIRSNKTLSGCRTRRIRLRHTCAAIPAGIPGVAWVTGPVLGGRLECQIRTSRSQSWPGKPPVIGTWCVKTLLTHRTVHWR